MASSKKAGGFGLIVFALAMTQFIMTVDLTIMNVIVPTLVEEFNTTIGTVQAAITLYALVMASLMLLGGKLGEIHGRKKMFQLGLVIYGIGSFITAIAPNIQVLIIGWSFLEGIGAALMMPAMLALISVNFQGKNRLRALGITAGVAGAAAALGPIIGGALATYATWRYAFFAEAVLAISVLILSKFIYDDKTVLKEKLDLKGAAMTITGLSLFVIGILQASTYGWIKASQPLVIGTFSFDLFGLSIVPFISGLGLIIIWRFAKYSQAQEKVKKAALLRTSLLEIVTLKAGVSIVLITQLVLAGILFILPLFLTLVIGYTALETGLALFPISISLILASVFSSRIVSRLGQVRTIRMGQIFILSGLGLLVITISNDTLAKDLIMSFLFLGAGIGFVIPVVQSVVLESADKRDSSQVAGLNYTCQQLGSSLGTALIGSVLLFSLGAGIVEGLEQSKHFDQVVIAQNSGKISNKAEFLSDEQLVRALEATSLSKAQSASIIQIKNSARIRALKAAIGAAFVIALLGLTATSRLGDEFARKKVKATD